MQMALSGKSENRDSNLFYISNRPDHIANARKRAEAFHTVSFDRKELNQILRVYGYRVASGEWRDYAIDMLKERAVFSIFKRTSEVPLYSIEKNPKLARKQGAFSVVNASGHIMKRGHELAQVLKFFDKKSGLIVV